MANADVRLEQLSHAFLFGCNAFDLLDEGSPYDPCRPTERTQRNSVFLKHFGELFNFATLPFYWGSFEPIEGRPVSGSMLDVAHLLKSAGYILKGHPLCWHTLCADWLLKYDVEKIHELQIERILRDVEGFKGLIDIWDVINETVIMPRFNKYDNAVTRLCNHLGRSCLIQEVFSAARAKNKSATLILNDFDLSPEYEEIIESCMDDGVDFDVIGIQSHMHQGYWGMEELQDVLNRFSRFGKPIHFTELTILSGDTFVPKDLDDLNDYAVNHWPSTSAGEARQAKEVCEFYTALFEHPAVEAITWWDFSDGKWLNAPSGLIRKDLTPKPAFFALRELIREKWWTPTLGTKTDDNGEIEFHGFFGAYELTIDGESLTIDLPDPYQHTPSDRRLVFGGSANGSALTIEVF